MKLYLIGHDYKYAAEQMLLMLFPGERPEYPETPSAPEETQVRLSLSRGRRWVTATAKLVWKGQAYAGAARCPDPTGLDDVARSRVLQHTLKQAFYKAGVQALGQAPAWGALTGVRPVKLPTRFMEEGLTPVQARRRLEQTYHVSPPRAELAVTCAQASLAVKRALEPHHFSLYVGIPFCPSRCAYCSFISADVKGCLKLVEPYLAALERETACSAGLARQAGMKVRSIYIGGGTPTTLEPSQLDRVMAAVQEGFDLSECLEYTVEAGRPDTITGDKLAAIRRGGGDRISVNPQSMRDEVLRAMGRAHTAADILRAYDLVRRAGFRAVNMDLIAGLPGDDLSGFQYSLDQVLSLAPENITVHTLALKRGSALTQSRQQLPDGAQVARMLDYAWDRLSGAGYVPYYLYRQKYMSGSFENVGWCRPGFESLYNIAMMEEHHTILSLGGGGVTKLVDPAAGHIQRIANPKYPYDYIDHPDQLIRAKQVLLPFWQGLLARQVPSSRIDLRPPD